MQTQLLDTCNFLIKRNSVLQRKQKSKTDLPAQEDAAPHSPFALEDKVSAPGSHSMPHSRNMGNLQSSKPAAASLLDQAKVPPSR